MKIKADIIYLRIWIVHSSAEVCGGVLLYILTTIILAEVGA